MARRRAFLFGLGLSALAACLLTVLPPFRAGIIEVRGNHSLAFEDIVRWSGLKRGRPLVLVFPRRAAARLLRCPLVLEADVRCVLPGRVVVAVREAVPVAVLDGGADWATVDDRGVVVARGTAPAPPPALVRVTWAGAAEAPSIPGVGETVPVPLLPGLALAATLGRRSGLEIAAISVGDDGRLEMTTRDGVRVLVGSVDETLSSRLAGLVPVLDDLHRAGAAVEYVDIRFRGPPAVMPADGAPAAGG